MSPRAYQYQRKRDIFVDVDKTLMICGELNTQLAEWLEEKKGEGFTLYLWSARGGEYARDMAERMGVVSMFTAILPKPSYVVDDMGRSWTKYIQTLHPSQIEV